MEQQQQERKFEALNSMTMKTADVGVLLHIQCKP